MLREDTFDPQTVVRALTVAMPGSVEMLFGPRLLAAIRPKVATGCTSATNVEGGDERWLDGLSGHLCGRRLDAWDNGTVDIFAFELRAIAQRLARWLATMQAAGFEATGTPQATLPRPTDASVLQ